MIGFVFVCLFVWSGRGGGVDGDWMCDFLEREGNTGVGSWFGVGVLDSGLHFTAVVVRRGSENRLLISIYNKQSSTLSLPPSLAPPQIQSVSART